jgi:hypothetical protein
MNEFEKLIAELDAYERFRDERRELHAMATGNTPVGRQFRKAMSDAVEALAPKRRTVIFMRKDTWANAPAIGETIAKAFAALNSEHITPSQRGVLMLKLSELADSVAAQGAPFAKALRPDATRRQRPDDDDEELPQSPRSLASRLKEIEAHLDRHAENTHFAEAEKLMASAQKMLEWPESMSMGDHACLRIQLDGLRQKVQGGQDAKR